MLRNAGWIALVVLLCSACSAVDEPSPPPVGTVQLAYGEPQGGFPSWYERIIHVLVNRARSDPQAALAGCSNCADAPCFPNALSPMEWDYDHNRAARFHATNLTDSGCGMLHNSPCALVANIGSIYPSPCDGSVSCACVGGTASCSGGDSFGARLTKFSISGARAENIAWLGDPFSVFYAWLWESTSNPACQWTMENGHRWNILGGYTRIGVGGDGGYTVQDFSDDGSLSEPIPAGAHYPQTGTSLEMRANWFDSPANLGAFVNIDGTCHAMSLERGSATNGTYLYNASVSSGCHQYTFVFADSNGQNVIYPDTGSFQVNCGGDWTSGQPPLGTGCPGTGSCGDGNIDAGETCDPPASCPDCIDGDDCTEDNMTGSPATCDVVCDNPPITSCTDNDNCCPAACNANNDNDCTPSCGNSAVELGETCDPPASCPDCIDGNDCTEDNMTGSPGTCDVVCDNPLVTSCTNNDNCCPSGCDANNDNDCSPSCGNDVVEPGETCDPPATCPTACDDGNDCTVDNLTGSAANCNAACNHSTIGACANGDLCCPAGCDANNDNDCSPNCGNDVVEPGETCDPPASCPTACDDGNDCTVDSLTGSAANCNAACSFTTVVSCTDSDGCCPAGCDANADDDCSPSCGNDVVEPGETCDPPASCPTSCDDGNDCTVDSMTGSAANCNAACSFTEIVSCANGDQCCPAGCDANNDNNCSASCGNDVVEPGESCDPPASCPQSCDDGNDCTFDGMTGSAANCNAACSYTEIVSCAAGDGCCPAGCDANLDTDCSAGCGNDVIEPGETCDPPANCPADCDDAIGCTIDNMTGSAANCNAACSYTTIVSCAEGDGCCPVGCGLATDGDCTCGDGVIDEGETCDPPETCPTECVVDGDPCTQDTVTGSPERCDVVCNAPITECTPGDGCCPAGCAPEQDGDCSADNTLYGSCDCRIGSGGSSPPWLLLGLPLVAVRLRRRLISARPAS